MRTRLMPYLLGALLLLAPACMKKMDGGDIPPRPSQQKSSERGSVRAEHKGHPKIDGQQVRNWFGMVSFDGWRRLSIFSEFHPDEGSFVARYGQKTRVFYLSYVDNQRMSQFGLQRSAREMLMVGRNSVPQAILLDGRTWYGQKDGEPVLATDVTSDVRVLLMGYKGLELEDLEKLAVQLPLDKLEAMEE